MCSTKDDIDNLDEWISLTIWTKALSCFFGVSEDTSKNFWLNHRYHPALCVIKLLELCKRPIYIHFDEVSELESDMFLKKFLPEYDDQRSDYFKLLIYYQFWRAVFPITKQNTFVYSSGRSFKLSELGRSKLQVLSSPCPILHLYLSTFTINDIKDALIYTPNIYQYIDASLFDEISEWLHQWTSGVPRLVCYGIKGIVATFESKKLINHPNMHLETLLAPVVEAMMEAPDTKLAYKASTRSTNYIFRALLWASASEFTFKQDERLST
jgi:hypothetical protein